MPIELCLKREGQIIRSKVLTTMKKHIEVAKFSFNAAEILHFGNLAEYKSHGPLPPTNRLIHKFHYNIFCVHVESLYFLPTYEQMWSIYLPDSNME